MLTSTTAAYTTTHTKTPEKYKCMGQSITYIRAEHVEISLKTYDFPRERRDALGEKSMKVCRPSVYVYVWKTAVRSSKSERENRVCKIERQRERHVNVAAWPSPPSRFSVAQMFCSSCRVRVPC